MGNMTFKTWLKGEICICKLAFLKFATYKDIEKMFYCDAHFICQIPKHSCSARYTLIPTAALYDKHAENLAAYPLLFITINLSFCWLFMIFLTINMFSNCFLKGVYNAHTIVKINKTMQGDLLPNCLCAAWTPDMQELWSCMQCPSATMLSCAWNRHQLY